MPRALLAIPLVLAACSGPHMVYRTVTARTFRGVTDCTQDLFTTVFQADGAKWGEAIEVEVCAASGVVAEARISLGHLDVDLSVGDGVRQTNGRCVVGDAEVVAIREASAHPGGAGAGGGEAEAAPAGGGHAEELAFLEIRDVGGSDWCPYGLGAIRSSTLELWPLEKGTPIRVHVWSATPNDVRGALVRVIHQTGKPNVSDQEWAKHLEKEERERARRHEPGAPLTEEAGPPPPARVEAQAPRPSVHAEWVPGYWLRAEGQWLWIAGQWRVPEADVSGGLTTCAPGAPPSPRRDASGPPRAGVVWADGYWGWDGQAWVWVAGGWRVPPQAGVIWRAPSWRPDARGVVFVPEVWIRP
jgi:hypothetical protein